MSDPVGEASQELLEMAADGADAGKLVEAAYRRIGKPIALVDELYRVLAFCAPGIPPEDCERRNDDNPAERRAWHRRVESSSEPVIDENGGGPYRAMCLDVRFRNRPVARLAVMETSPFTETDPALVKVLAQALALQYVSSHSEPETDRDRERSALLEALLRGEPPAGLKSVMEYLGIPDGQPVRIFALRAADDRHPDRQSFQEALAELFDSIFCRADGGLCFVTGAEEYAANRDAVLALLVEHGLLCGASRVFTKLGQAREFRLQAEAALECGFRSGRVLSEYEDCMSEDAVSVCLNSRPAYTWCRPEILTLAEYDRTHETDYLDTLTCYLDTLCSMAETSRRTFLHYNTIKYRLRVIEEVCGIHDISGEDLWEYLFSIRMLKRE